MYPSRERPGADLVLLHAVAVWLCDSREQALAQVQALVAAQPRRGLTGWLSDLIRTLVQDEQRARPAVRAPGLRQSGGDRFDALAGLLSLERQVAVGLDHPLVAREPRRLQVLQWQLKRGCLAAAVRALWPTRRAMFVLLHVFALPIARVAEIFETTPTSIRVTNSRTLRTLAGYLGPRCQHLAADNPCRCEDRLGGALADAFVAWPASDLDEQVAKAPLFDGQRRDVAALYAGLPAVQADARALEVLGELATRLAAEPDPVRAARGA
jgi:DNA-directed RNA polymerase specialized sigma24 family protein